MYVIIFKVLEKNGAFSYKQFDVYNEDDLRNAMIFYKKNNCVIDELYEAF